MVFPHYFHLLGRPLHPHPVMELIAYSGGFQFYLWLRRRSALLHPDRPAVAFEQMMWIIVGAIFGALFGSKLLAWVESPLDYFPRWREPATWMGGKTIVGGLLGGWVGVEIAKKLLGVSRSTGDLYVFPLIFGMAVGRIGCFLTGLDDHTYGNLSSLPWAVDFGDGPRHPTQLYDILFLAVFGAFLFVLSRRPLPNGLLFRSFMLGYLLYRFAIEFLKPRYHPWLGLSAIQLACLLSAALCAVLIREMKQTPRPETMRPI
jgi:phosphatidylglycerol:prolipoprotein diacylglycerol transferase